MVTPSVLLPVPQKFRSVKVSEKFSVIDFGRETRHLRGKTGDARLSGDEKASEQLTESGGEPGFEKAL